MNNEELLTLAAKTINLQRYKYCEVWDGMAKYSLQNGYSGPEWRPHKDYKDATCLLLEMAQKGDARLQITEQGVVCYYNHGGLFVPVMFDYDSHSAQEAFCLAITHAAAELGKLMK